MRESLYRQVDAEYALQREKDLNEQEARQAEAEAADPQIGALAERRMERFRQAAQRMFRDGENARENSEALKKEIQNYVKAHTAPYKYPRIVVFRDELPKTISGKIQRNKL